jgi:hypothetical protein
VLDALAAVDRPAGLAYLTGPAAGYAQRAGEVTVETVWSGPGSHHVPVRATAAVLADVVREARHELPIRAAEHVDALRSSGILNRLS